MGNTSSQPAATQLRHEAIDGVIPTSHDDSDMEMATERFSTPGPIPNPRQKRSRSSTEHDGAKSIPSKKAKLGHEESAKTKQKRLRSLPQHLRGTSIMPSQGPAAEERPTSSQSKSVSFAASDGDGGQVEVRKRGTVVNPIGRPGPRKEKKDKKVKVAKKRSRDSTGNNAFEKTSQSSTPNIFATNGQRTEDAESSRDNVPITSNGNPDTPREQRKRRRDRLALPMPEADEVEDQPMPDSLNANLDAQEHTVSAVPADRIPTPPESPEAEDDEAGEADGDRDEDDEADSGDYENDGEDVDDAVNKGEHDNEADEPKNRTAGYKKPSRKIRRWLRTQASAAHPDKLSPSRGSPDVQRKPRQRRISQEHDDDSDEYEDVAEQESESEIAGAAPKLKDVPLRMKPVQQKNHPGSSHSAVAASGIERGTKRGAWSAAEKNTADAIFKRACEQAACSDFDMKTKMTDWANIGQIKNNMYEAFPSRTISTIRKFCLRRFTPHDTGPWTKKQDKRLKKAYAEHPGKWTEIQTQVHRSADDCRNRWRVKNGFEDATNSGPWSRNEEQALVQMVEQHLPLVREECEDEEMKNNTEAIEKMLHWASIAKDLGGHRTGSRCREKWYKLKTRIDAVVPVESSAITVGRGKRQRQADRDYAKLGWADVWDALNEIHTAFSAKELRGNRYAHESTFWSIVAKRTTNSRFGGKLRRRAYYGALEKWQDEDRIRQLTGIGLKAYWLNHLVAQSATAREITFERWWKITPDTGLNAGDGLPELFMMQHLETVKDRMKRKERNWQLFAHESELDSNGNLIWGLPQGYQPTKGADEILEVPETQLQTEDDLDAVAGAKQDAPDNAEPDEMQIDEELEMSSINSRSDGSLRSGTPHLSSRQFLKRCQAVGRAQHRAYVSPSRRVAHESA